MTKLIPFFLVLLLTVGCAVGPNYKRPDVHAPDAYRGVMPQEAAQPAAESLGDQKWWEVFQDEELQKLIRTALQQNYDVQIAAARILQAQAQLGITRADQLPSIAAGTAAIDQRSPQSKVIPAFNKFGTNPTLSVKAMVHVCGTCAVR